MNILLVCPQSAELVGSHPSFLPLGVAYIAAVLEQDGHRVEVLDLSVAQYDDQTFQEIVRRGYYQSKTLRVSENPKGFKAWDIIGFTVVTPTANQVYRLAGMVKAHSDALVIAGGPHVTALPEEALNHGIDIVVRGEGEATIRAVCQTLPAFENLATVQGISYIEHGRQGCLRSASGKIMHTPARDFIADLDTLPFPARHLFSPLESYKGQPILGAKLPIGNLMTSRGCPFNCNFCYKAIFGRKYRFRSTENILAEWRELIERYDVKEIAISDDLFNAHPARAIALCERIIKEKLVLPWSCPNGLRVDTASEELLHKMKQAGCYRVAFGVESGSQQILDKIGKHVTLAQIETAFVNARKCGLRTTAFLMLGNPGDTEATMQATIAFTKKLGPDFAQFTIATPYPGTALYELVRKNGKLLVADWDDYDKYDDRVFFELDGLDNEVVLCMQRHAYREFYLQPRYIARKLLTRDTYKYFGRSLKGLLKFVIGGQIKN
jgi:anaerobic magnesium-protoporphyrin IX monomethyl ester cyclase